MLGVARPRVLWVAGLSHPNVAEDEVYQLQVEEREVLNPLQGQVGHAADESLLLS